MVALTHNTARQLGYALSAGGRRTPVRRGVGAQGPRRQGRRPARRAQQKAGEEVAKRNADLAADDIRRIAETIAIAAVRYFMVRFSRGKVIAFDIDEALNFEGESGPYLQYAVVRANNIFQKLRDGKASTKRSSWPPRRARPPTS